MCFNIPSSSRFPSCSSTEAENQRAIHDQYEASIREWHNIAAFRAHLDARRRSDTENFLVRTVGLVPIQDEPSLKDVISSYFMEQRRLMAEHQSEVRNTLQAILAHLSKDTTVKTPTESDPVTSPAATSTTAVDVDEEGPIPLQQGNGKSKENADSDTPEEPSAQVASSLFQISSVTARLETLLAAFQFPAELDISPALGTADVFALTYTPVNSPVLTQAYALSLLFADLDNIPSFGSDVVRNARRAAVTRVDQALQQLDEGVEERRGRARAKKADPITLPVDQPAHPNDGDLTGTRERCLCGC